MLFLHQIPQIKKGLGLSIRAVLAWTLLIFGIGQRYTPAKAEPSTTITVNSILDNVDANPSDGICETATGNSVCTLRAAIQTANALAGKDTIIIPSGIYTLTIEGSVEDNAQTGDLDIRDDLTIQGADPATTVIDGNSLDRIFHIPLAKIVTISNLTIQNGTNVASGAGIFNIGGTLTLNNMVFKDNHSNLENGNGGALDNFNGFVLINNSEIRNNRAQSNGGGIYNNNGKIQIENSTIISNTTVHYHGGGIGSTGPLIVNRTTVSENTAGLEGAGIEGGGIYARGPLTITNSTISGNYSLNLGGGLYISSTLSLENSTISANTAGFDGGGIYIKTNAVLANVTLMQNSANNGGNIYNDGSLSIKNSLIDDSLSGGNCYGTVSSLGYNISSDNSCALSAAGDLNLVDPLLGALQDNGGATFTHALPPNSPAIDNGNPSGCTGVLGNLLDFDQRGLFRHSDGNGNLTEICDSGAYEYTAIDLAVAKTNNRSFVVPGVSTAYTITVSNTGPGKINNIQLSDLLAPEINTANWTCVASSGSSCHDNAGSGNMDLDANLSAGGVITAVLTAAIDPGVTGVLVNTASVAPPEGAIETNTDNNSATDTDTIVPVADLAITQSISPDPIRINALLTYQLNIQNIGPSQAASVVVSDTLPGGVTFDHAAGSGWTCNGTNAAVNCIRSILPVGSSPPITIQVYAPTATGVMTNTAVVTSAVSDPNLSNNLSETVSTIIQFYYAILPVILK